jgi:hypothetical protein
MKTDSSQLLKIQAIRQELEKSALQKVKAIQEKILTHKSKYAAEDIQILTMVNDELEDILLNWEVESISSIPPIIPTGGDLDDLDD